MSGLGTARSSAARIQCFTRKLGTAAARAISGGAPRSLQMIGDGLCGPAAELERQAQCRRRSPERPGQPRRPRAAHPRTRRGATRPPAGMRPERRSTTASFRISEQRLGGSEEGFEIRRAIRTYSEAAPASTRGPAATQPR